MENKAKSKINQTKLSQIQQVSAENYTKNITKQATVIEANVRNTKISQTKKWLEPLLCIKNLIKYCIKRQKSLQFDINEQQMTREVQKIKRKKHIKEVLLPANDHPKLKTLVLDLDETLIHTSFKKKNHYDFSTNIEIKGRTQKVYVTKRFGLDIFLFQMSQLYELVVFTAGIKDYTDRILQIIDPQKRISHVLYREHCTILNNTYFLKNMSMLGRNLKQTILIDDNSMAGMLQPEIFYKIAPFHGDSHDRKLLRLIEFLKIMSDQEDFSVLGQKRKTFDSKQTRPKSLSKASEKTVMQWGLKEEPSTQAISQNSLVKQQRGSSIEL